MAFRSTSLAALLLASSIVAVALCPAVAQDIVTQSGISGTIVDALTKKGIPAARADVTGPTRRSAVADAAGRFTIPNLIPGIYELRITADRFRPAQTQQVVVASREFEVVFAALASSATRPTIGHVSTSSARINTSAAAVLTLSSTDIIASGQGGYRRVLEQLPGVTIGKPISTGQGSIYVGTPYGSLTPSIRGAQPYETASLYDGHRLSPYAGTFGYDAGGSDLQYVDVRSTDRVSVVRGPGADSPTINNAIGGTIEFYSGRPAGKPHGSATSSYDGNGSLTFAATAEGETPNHRFGAALSASTTNTSFPYTIPPKTYLDGEFDEYSLPFPVNGQFFVAPPTTYADPATQPVGTTPFAACCIAPGSAYGGRHTTFVKLRDDVAPTVSVSALISTLSDSYQEPANGNFYPYVYTGPPSPGLTTGTRILTLQLPYAYVSNQAYSRIAELTADARIGAVALRASYLAQDIFNGAPTLAPGIVYGTYAAYGSGFLYPVTADQPPAPNVTFNGNSIVIAPVFAAHSTYSWRESQSRDGYAEVTVPTSPTGVARLAFDESWSPGYGIGSPSAYSYEVTSATPTVTHVSNPVNGSAQAYVSEKVEYEDAFARNVRAQLALYFNQYRYNALISSGKHDQYYNAIGANFASYAAGYVAPRVAFTYRPASPVAWRFAAGGGIAPLQVNAYGATANAFPLTNRYNAGNHYYQINGQSGALRPETSFGEDLGLDAQLSRNTLISADAYHTLLHGQYFSSTTLVSAGCYALFGAAACGAPDAPVYASVPANLGQSRMYGLEIDVRHDPDRGFAWHASASTQRAYAYNIPASFYLNAAGERSANVTILPNVNFNGSGNSMPIPYVSGYASFGYNAARWNSTVGITYYGTNNSYYLPATYVLDVGAHYRVARGLTLDVNALNLTNQYGGTYFISPRFYVLNPAIPGVANPPTSYNSYATPLGPRSLALSLTQRL